MVMLSAFGGDAVGPVLRAGAAPFGHIAVRDASDCVKYGLELQGGRGHQAAQLTALGVVVGIVNSPLEVAEWPSFAGTMSA